MFECRFLSKGALGPKKSHFNLLFQRQTGGHDLSKQTRHIFIAQGTHIFFHDRAQYLSFTLGSIIGLVTHLFFDLSNILGTARTGADIGHNLSIKAVNLVAQFEQWILFSHYLNLTRQRSCHRRSHQWHCHRGSLQRYCHQQHLQPQTPLPPARQYVPT